MEIVLLYLASLGTYGLGYLSRAIIGRALSERFEEEYFMRKQSNHTRRMRRIPMGSLLRDQFRLQLHVAMGQLAYKPCAEPYNALAEVFNVVQVALEDDRHHVIEAAVISTAARALVAMKETVARRIPPYEGELAQVRAGVNQIDNLLGRMDVSRLYVAMQTLNNMKDAE